MPKETPLQEQIGFTPRQRLDCINFMISLTDFSDKYEQLNAEERDEFGVLQDAAMAANESNVAQHYFEQLKIFFVEKLGYDANLFKDESLAQFYQQFNNLMAVDEERDEIAEKMIPDVEQRIKELRRKRIGLGTTEPRTAEIETEMRVIIKELHELVEKREKVVEAVYDTRHKNSKN